MRRANRICVGIVLLLAAVSLREGYRLWEGMGGVGLLPVIVGGSLALLGVALIADQSRWPAIQPVPWPGQVARRQLISVYAICAAYAVALPWLGYPIPTTLFLFGLIRSMGGTRVATGFVFSLVTSVFTYVVFKSWLHMPFPSGPLGF